MKRFEARAGVTLALGTIVAAIALIWGVGEYRAIENRVSLRSEIEMITENRALMLDESDYVAGDPDAKIVVVEYFDLECPYCKMFHARRPYFESQFIGRGVAFVSRHLPLTYLHVQALEEAIALECAGMQKGSDGYFPYRNMVYANTKGEDTLDLALLPQFAASLALDMDAFTNCRSGPEVERRITEDIVSAAVLGISSTPAFALYKDGEFQYVIAGGSAVGWRNLEIALEDLLKE